MINEYKPLSIGPTVIDGRPTCHNPIKIRKFDGTKPQLSPQTAALRKLIATHLLKKIPDLQGIRKVRNRLHNSPSCSVNMPTGTLRLTCMWFANSFHSSEHPVPQYSKRRTHTQAPSVTPTRDSSVSTAPEHTLTCQ